MSIFYFLKNLPITGNAFSGKSFFTRYAMKTIRSNVLHASRAAMCQSAGTRYTDAA